MYAKSENAQKLYSQMQEALKHVNQEFGNNIKFKYLHFVNPHKLRFRLTVKNSSGPGAKRNPDNGRKICAACWHVHGRFFDALFGVSPNAVIYSLNEKITRDDAWRDWVVRERPRQFASEFCKCPYEDVCDW